MTRDDIRLMSRPHGDDATAAEPVGIGILTVSDRASAGVYEDTGGAAVVATLREILITPWRPCRLLVPDERPAIETALAALADEHRCPLIVTTGGTGPAPRDVTPEATEAVCGRMLPGFGELMRTVSLRHVPTAILSRQTAGIRGGSLIVNLPGRPAAVRDCLLAVFGAIPYGIDLIGGPRLDTDPAVVRAFRPGEAAKPAGPGPDTAWLELLLSEEAAFERLVVHAPRAGKFRRVLNDEEVARRLSVADVARMLGLSPELLLAVALDQPADGLDRGTPAEPEDSAWADAAGLRVPLDLRPLFAAGHEPLATVLEAVDRLPGDAALVIDAPFHPLPLRRLLGGRGYPSAARCIAPDHWRVAFRRAAA